MKSIVCTLLVVSSFSAFAEPTPAKMIELNGIVAGLRCSGALVTLGRRDDQRALVLTAGHCTSTTSQYATGTAEGGRLFPKQSEGTVVYIPSTDSNLASDGARVFTNFWIHSVFYATMTRTDIALYEIDATIGELKSKGIRFFELADHLPKTGEVLRITSGFAGMTEECTVADIFPTFSDERKIFDYPIPEGGDSSDASYPDFRNSILLDRKCFAKNGWSGSPIFDEKTRLVYGVLSRTPTRESPASPGVEEYKVPKDETKPIPFSSESFSSSSPKQERKDASIEVVASNVAVLNDCLTNSGELTLGSAGCKLPKITARTSVLLPEVKPIPVPAPAPAPAPRNKATRWP
ncbi:MAG: hypothetical protein H7301_10205 [Cryobacterium sp.]|nr:hypothetical protein [Oligoflexia bacterium]